MIYFLFFFLHFIIADENTNRNDESYKSEQTIGNNQDKSLSSNENNSDSQDSSSSTSNDLNLAENKKTKPLSQFPHRTLKRMNATNFIPKLELNESESTTIGIDKNESTTEKTPKINPLRRRNAKINIPKVELNEEPEKNTQEIKNVSQNQPNPDFDNEEAFREDPSDPFDDEDEDKINTEDKNKQIETQDQSEKSNKFDSKSQSENTPNPTETSLPTQTETPLPLQTETPIPSQTKTPTPTPSPTEVPTTDSTIPDFEEITDEEVTILTSAPFTNNANSTENSDQNHSSDSNKNNNNFPDTEAKAEKTVVKKRPKFHIVSVSPQTISTRGDEKIEITMNTTLDGPPFIKFGEDKIVHGRHSKKDLTVKCRTPRLQEGEIEISVSIDKIKWSDPFSLVVVADEADLPWIFVGCAGLAIIAVSLMISKLICGKRAVPKKKKHSKYDNEDLLNIMAPNYKSNDLRKRTKIPTEV